MESEVRQQPEVLSTNAPRYLAELKSALKGKSFDMALLAARGSSDNAALYARYLIEIHLGIPVSLAAPSVITKFGSEMRYPKCLAIGISQSGAAPDVSEVIAHLRKQGHTTVGITNTPGSLLDQESAFCLCLDAGLEEAVAATKTYTASLLAIYQLVSALGADLPDPDLLYDSLIEEYCEAAEKSLGAVLRCSTIFALSRGYNYCTAYETALKLTECALLPCKPYSTADFEHGPKALANYGSAAIVFGDVPKHLADYGCIPLQAPRHCDRPCRPISDIVYGQWVALLASRARGPDPDSPQIITKVTKTP